MKTLKSLPIILVVLLSASFASSEWVQLGAFDSPVPIEMNLLESSDDRLLFEVIVHGFETEDVVEDVDSTPTTFQRISIPEAGELVESGDPALPFESYLFAAPDGVSFSIDVIADEYVDLEDYYVLPAYEWTEDWGGNLAFTINDGSGEVYDTDGFFPDDMEELGANSGSQYLQEQRLVSASYIPFEFNPEDEVLRIYTYSLVEIDFTGIATWSTSGVGPYEDMLASMAPNYEEISPAELQTNSASLYKFAYDEDYFEDDIECDYLVIAAKTFADMIDPIDDNNQDEELEKLLRWRSTDNNSPNGFDIMVANVDEIVKWYEDDDDADRSDFNNYEVAIMIDDFIEEVYDETSAPHTFGDKLSYLLIVGDSHSKNFTGSGTKWKPYDVIDDFEVPVTIYDCTSGAATVSDLPYACIDDQLLYVQFGIPGDTYLYNEHDEYPELKMGRITADNALEEDFDQNDNRDAEAVMNDIAEKIYNYEQNTTYSDSWRRRRYYFSGFYQGRGSHGFRSKFRDWRQLNHDFYEKQQGYTYENIEIRDYELDDYSGSFSDLVDDCRDDLIAGLTETSSEQLFFFSCHGSYNGMLSYELLDEEPWYSEQYIMDNDTVDDLDFGDDYPVVFGYVSCSTANFCESFYEDKGEDSPSPITPDNRCFG